MIPGILTERYSLNPAWVEQVADATRPTHACHVRCDANFYIQKLLQGAPFKVNHIQLELLR